MIEQIGDPTGGLILDETGFVKKGTHSVGVARQCSDTVGRVENCQIGVKLKRPPLPVKRTKESIRSCLIATATWIAIRCKNYGASSPICRGASPQA